MMVVLASNGGKFTLSYQQLKNEYLEIVEWTDGQFLAGLPRVLHLACVISWFKELPADDTLGDQGIVHELVHLMHSGTTTPLSEIRASYKELLRLA
jgi:hypothetical protein